MKPSLLVVLSVLCTGLFWSPIARAAPVEAELAAGGTTFASSWESDFGGGATLRVSLPMPSEPPGKPEE
jgi:hypothetical protein